jgi:NitT/TauT family transport system substrate-binding protein
MTARRAACALVLAALAGCGGGQTAGGGRTARLFLNWFPEHEHGGYFAALVGGLYRDAGLDVQILPGGPQAPVAARVASGDVEFGILNADDVLLARAAGVPLVALFAPLQTSPACVMVHRSAGIERLADLRDLTLAMQVAAAHFQYLQRHVPLTGVTIVPYSGSIAEFLANPRWAQQAYAISEPILAAAKGSDPRCLLIADIGFNPYTSVLVTREALIRTAPDVVRGMVAASAKGWKRYLEDPAPAHARILELNPEVGRPTLDRGVQALAPFVLTEDALGRGIGTMSADRWQALAAQMLDARSLAQPVDPTAAFDAGFLPRP